MKKARLFGWGVPGRDGKAPFWPREVPGRDGKAPFWIRGAAGQVGKAVTSPIAEKVGETISVRMTS